MKKNQLLSIIAVAFIFAACSSSKEPTGVWVNKEKIQGKKFTNIFFMVITADIQARVNLENELEAVAVSRGLKAVKSIDVLPPSLNDPKKLPTKEEIVNKVKASGCDGVFIASLLKKDDSLRYTPETQSYTVVPYYAYTGNYYGFYSNISRGASRPDYYTEDKTYFILSNLYDAASEEIMWSAQSKVFNPSSLAAFSKKYISTLLDQLATEKLLK